MVGHPSVEPTPHRSQPVALNHSRYAEIYWLMIRNSLIREMNFKANFILWMVVELLWFLGQIVFLEVLFGQVDKIGDGLLCRDTRTNHG